MGTPFSNQALQARLDALDACEAALATLPGDHAGTVQSIETAKGMLTGRRNVRAAHMVFREVRNALTAAKVSDPMLLAKLDSVDRYD